MEVITKTSERIEKMKLYRHKTRNHKCPCGSGKRFKRCCGIPEKKLFITQHCQCGNPYTLKADKDDFVIEPDPGLCRVCLEKE